MDLHEIIGIGFALGVDCLAVSAGISTTRRPRRLIVATCLMFGLILIGLAAVMFIGGL